MRNICSAAEDAVKSEQVLKNIQPKVEIRISATPITSGDEMVNIPREVVVARGDD
jgi:type III restriction enzyme